MNTPRHSHVFFRAMQSWTAATCPTSLVEGLDYHIWTLAISHICQEFLKQKTIMMLEKANNVRKKSP